jgi:single-strand DNA-binding protein
MKVAVQGKLHWSQWEKDGQKRSKLEVWPDTVELLSPKKDNAQGGYQKDMGTVAAEAAFGVQMQPVQEGFSSIYDEDIPF